jgi:hypothetical protein
MLDQEFDHENLCVNWAESIKGWMTTEELRWLAETASGLELVIEFGTWRGRSTAALTTAKQVVCCDSWCGQKGVRLEPELFEDGLPFSQFFETFTDLIDDAAVVPYVMDLSNPLFVDALVAEFGGKAEMVFIDADHSKEGVLRDIDTAKRLLIKGGILCGHDYNEPDWPGVTEAVNERLKHFSLPAGSIWVRTYE